MISLRGVTRTFHTGYESVVAVDRVDLEVAAGELVCLFGASGSGKSTLLGLVAGLDVPDSGHIEVAGASLVGLSENARADLRLHKVGVVFQDHQLIDELTCRENVVLPLLTRGLSRSAADAECRRALDRLGVGELADRRPPLMSGGQRQRVGIARALAGDRTVLLADEPTGALDSLNSRALFQTIRELCREVGIAAVVATHDPLAREYADRIETIVDGRLVTSG